MRNYIFFDGYLNDLQGDIYDQPTDEGHTGYAKEFIHWVSGIVDIKGISVLDVGCGQGFCAELFKDYQVQWQGVTLGNDYQYCKRRGLNVVSADMTFLPNEAVSVDAVFSRHSLEHSPFPILTLMEWYRVSRKYLFLCLPSPEFYGVGGKNHYSVLTRQQWWFLLRRAGWHELNVEDLNTHQKRFLNYYRPEVKDPRERSEMQFPGPPKTTEYWYVLEKGIRIKE